MLINLRSCKRIPGILLQNRCPYQNQMARKTRSNRRQSRKQKQKQSRKQKTQKQQGGARKASRKASSWAKAVGEMYRKMKAKNANTTLGDAMKEASKARAAGKL